MKFEIIKADINSKARAGEIETDHGKIQTPIFMPVGTLGTVKAVNQKELIDTVKAQIILGNTYHLYLRPGLEVMKNAGGLHSFMNWQKPILTDSGGYQVYSLSSSRKIDVNGVKFKSHIDGSSHYFTPEYAIDIQRIIGADFIMAFDECTPYPCDYNYAKNSMELTHKWLNKCIIRMNETKALYGHNQTLVPIVQGSVYDDLRKISAEYVESMDLEANAIGGLSVGEPEEEMYKHTEIVCNILNYNKPRYLMGVGTPTNLLENIALGIDMFDCVMPTRNARNGMLFTSEGVLNMKNQKWENDFSPIDSNGTAWVDNYFTKSYLRHLFKAKEILASEIASIHNLAFYLWLVTEARNHIINGDFYEWKKIIIPRLENRL